MPRNGNGDIVITKGKVVISGAIIIAIVTAVIAVIPNLNGSQVKAIESRVVECEKSAALHTQQFSFIQKELEEIKKEIGQVKGELRLIWAGRMNKDIRP